MPRGACTIGDAERPLGAHRSDLHWWITECRHLLDEIEKGADSDRVLTAQAGCSRLKLAVGHLGDIVKQIHWHKKRGG